MDGISISADAVEVIARGGEKTDEAVAFLKQRYVREDGRINYEGLLSPVLNIVEERWFALRDIVRNQDKKTLLAIPLEQRTEEQKRIVRAFQELYDLEGFRDESGRFIDLGVLSLLQDAEATVIHHDM